MRPYFLQSLVAQGDTTLIQAATSDPHKVERELRRELSDIGIDWKSFKAALPEWKDVAFSSRAGTLELKIFLARNAGLEILEDGRLSTKALPAACFKTTSGTSPEQVRGARSIATACARLVARAAVPTWSGFPSDSAELRGRLAATNSNGWIDLPTLLRGCWSFGVPVLYMPSLPAIGRKMEGMVTFVAGRPVVILTKKVPHPDWLLFILAHEIGHIACNHLVSSEGQAIVDDKVDLDIAEADGDSQEREANSFATALLGPDSKECRLGRPWPNAPRLAAIAQAFGETHKMSPGYVILNAAHNSTSRERSAYPLAQAALKLLPDAEHGKDATAICRDFLTDNIDLDALSDDSIEYLENLAVIRAS